ncbi:hypothetical protein ACINNAV18_2656 [Acinetobacter baumannii Naval-18]|nr:hypothetical protein ACINNAV18_2656 [Acinetobacter baumannii Naval-18]
MSNLKDATIYYRDLKTKKLLKNRKKIHGPVLSNQLIN